MAKKSKVPPINNERPIDFILSKKKVFIVVLLNPYFSSI